MKRETIVAVLFGILFGAVVAFIILTKNKELQLTKTKTIAPTQNLQSANTLQTASKPLQIFEPQDGSVIDKDVVSIKGKAEKNSLLVIQSPQKDMVFKNEKEQFSQNFPLVLGENVIKVTLYAKDGQARLYDKELHVYFLEEQL